MDMTVAVTAIFNIGRENWSSYSLDTDRYLEWFSNLSDIDCPIIIFTDDYFYDKICDISFNRGHEVRVIKTRVEDLYVYKHFYGFITSNMTSESFKSKVRYDSVPEMKEPLYNVLMYNKTYWLLEAFNTIHANYYMWIDAGAFREKKYLRKWPTLTDDKIHFFAINDRMVIPDKENHLLGQVRKIQGGCFTCPRHRIEDLVCAFDKELRQVLHDGLVCSDEKLLDFAYINQLEDEAVIHKTDWRMYDQFFQEELKTIFVQIASYRDPDLPNTIMSLMDNADHPENITLGITNQFHPDDEFNRLTDLVLDKYKANVFRLDLSEESSNGVCWARNKLQEFYNDEDYTLQLDSHMRFKQGWDTFHKELLNDLRRKGSPKPLITAYAPAFDPATGEHVNTVWELRLDRMTPEGVIFTKGKYLDERPKSPIPGRFYSAHYAFTVGEFCKEVPHDPEYFFHGEEISIAVRAYTWGYDLYNPHKPYVWHEYTRKGRAKVWEDNDRWGRLNAHSLARNRRLLNVDNKAVEGEDFGRYGLGTERTLKDYEEYAGIRFSTREFTEHTKEGKPPPSSPDSIWNKYFKEPLVFNHYSDADLLWEIHLVDQEERSVIIEYHDKQMIDHLKELENYILDYKIPKDSTIKKIIVRRFTGEKWRENYVKHIGYE